ncbi:MAG: tetratricopeptide repeat protein [Negativicutes bacterium]|nr:tetratricopeptide repeat protein [Negativicutes bacterium]
MTVQELLDEGLALAAQGDFRAAGLSFCQAAKLDPNHPAPYQRLGEVLIPLEFWDDAEASFCKAIELQPHYPEAYDHLGVVLKKKNRIAEAEECFRQAIAQRPDYAEAVHNLGNCLRLQNRFDEAEACYLRAMGLSPDLGQPKFALATLYFLLGQYDKGWQLYETRFRGQGKFRLDIPIWKDEDLTGRRILLFYEQGFGDMIHFIRYAFQIATLAAETTVWIQKPLERLLAGTQTAFSVCANGREIDPRQFDYACSIFSLPGKMNTALKTIPNQIPYIQADDALAAKWGKEINPLAGGRLKVGLVWAGNPKHLDDENRSIPFALIDCLFAVDKVFWVSLQVGKKEPVFSGIADRLFDCSKELVDFAETAALIDNLDLVIAVDTAVAHLAGAMGKATWLLLPFRPEWRWGVEGQESLWYPTMRLFRQQKLSDWQEVLARVKSALEDAVEGEAERFFPR